MGSIDSYLGSEPQSPLPVLGWEKIGARDNLKCSFPIELCQSSNQPVLHGQLMQARHAAHLMARHRVGQRLHTTLHA